MADALDLQTLLRPQRTAPETGISPPPEREASAFIVAQAAMDDRCEVLRFQSLADETGGSTTVWTQAGSYPCRVEATKTAREGVVTAGNEASQVLYNVHLPSTAHVLASDRLGVPGWFNVWQGSREYSQGEKVISTAPHPGFYFECVQGGQSGAGEPPWAGQIGASVQDGTARWRVAARVQFLEVVAPIDATTNALELVVRAKEVS